MCLNDIEFIANQLKTFQEEYKEFQTSLDPAFTLLMEIQSSLLDSVVCWVFHIPVSFLIF